MSDSADSSPVEPMGTCITKGHPYEPHKQRIFTGANADPCWNWQPWVPEEELVPVHKCSTCKETEAELARLRPVVAAARELRKVTANPRGKSFDPAAPGWYKIRREAFALDKALDALESE